MRDANILLIEDEADILKIASKLLAMQGFTVHCAATGEAGIKTAQKEHIDLIILDLGLPDHDGYEVMKHLHAIEKTQDIPVVIFSAMVQKIEIEKAMSLGAIGFIKKPFDPMTLHEEVKSFLEQIAEQAKEASLSDGRIDEDLQKSYLCTFDDKLRILSTFIADENYDELRVFGHKLSGSGRSYGFDKISIMGKRIEDGANTKNIDDIKETVQMLSSFIEELKNNPIRRH